MPLITATAAGFLSATLVAQAGPVQTYTNAVNPSRSEGMFTSRQYVPNADPRPDNLLNPAPYPSNRADDPIRAEIGRLWETRVPVGNRTPLREITRVQPGPGSFGAPADALDDVIFVKSSERGVPVIAISPWTRLTEDNVDRIREDLPFLGSDLRGRKILADLRHAQRQWLKEQGYVAHVRTHVSPSRIYGPGVRPASEIKPHGILRIRPTPTDDSRKHVEVSPIVDPMTTVVSTDAVRRAPIVVVRQSESAGAAEAQTSDANTDL